MTARSSLSGRKQNGAAKFLFGLGVIAMIVTVVLGRQASILLRKGVVADATVLRFEKHESYHRGVTYTNYLPELEYRDRSGNDHTVTASNEARIGTKVGDHEPVMYLPGDEDDAEPVTDIWENTNDAAMYTMLLLGWSGVARVLGVALEQAARARAAATGGQQGAAEVSSAQPMQRNA